MMFGHELIESLHFIAPHRPCVQMDENLLFIGCGLAKGGDFFLFHVRQHKKLRPACPAKSFNAFPFSGFPLPKNAPYALSRCAWLASGLGSSGTQLWLSPFMSLAPDGPTSSAISRRRARRFATSFLRPRRAPLRRRASIPEIFRQGWSAMLPAACSPGSFIWARSSLK